MTAQYKILTINSIFALVLLAGCTQNNPNDFSKVTPGKYECVSNENEKIDITVSTEEKIARFSNKAEAMAAFVKPSLVSESASAEQSVVNFSNQTYAEGQEKYEGEKDAPEQARSSYSLDTAAGSLTRQLEYLDGMTNTPSYTSETTFKCTRK